MTPPSDRDDEPTENDDVLEELQRLRDDLTADTALVDTDPRDAFDLWIQQLGDARESTKQTYTYRIEPFLRFLDRREITSLSDVSTRVIKEFEAERHTEGERGQTALNNQLGTLRQFLAYCHDLDAVTQDVVEAVNVPELTKDDRVNEEKLVTERAEHILTALDRYRYASRDHVLMTLFWRTTMRLGAIRSLDVHDVYLTSEDHERLRQELRDDGIQADVASKLLEDVTLPVVYPRHRPESGTPLKNGAGGERVINIADWVGDVLQAYLDVNHPSVQDEHGRHPLLASRKGTGRLSASAIRNTVYILTQPCEFGDDCPYGEDPESCEAREHGHGSKCPGSRSPHKIRTGSITWHRDRGWPIPALADKANTSEELIRGVYDQPEQLVRGAVRREHLQKLTEDDDSTQ